MRRERFTKIVATLGPASSSPERLRALFEAGPNVATILVKRSRRMKAV